MQLRILRLLLMGQLIQWHKNMLNSFAHYLGLSLYPMLWLGFVKGVAIGYLIGEYL